MRLRCSDTFLLCRLNCIVFGEVDDVSTDTLGLPGEVLDATRVDQPPTLKEVLVAKAERAAQLLELATPYTIQVPDFA